LDREPVARIAVLQLSSLRSLPKAVSTFKRQIQHRRPCHSFAVPLFAECNVTAEVAAEEALARAGMTIKAAHVTGHSEPFDKSQLPALCNFCKRDVTAKLEPALHSNVGKLFIS